MFHRFQAEEGLKLFYQTRPHLFQRRCSLIRNQRDTEALQEYHGSSSPDRNTHYRVLRHGGSYSKWVFDLSCAGKLSTFFRWDSPCRKEYPLLHYPLEFRCAMRTKLRRSTAQAPALQPVLQNTSPPQPFFLQA